MSERPITAVSAGSPTDLLQRAIRRQQNGDLAGARQRCRAALAASPSNAEALRLLGEVEMSAGDCGAATNYYRAALRVDPGRADIQDRLGRALLARGDSGTAMRAFVAAIDIDPHYGPAYVGMGHAFSGAGRREQAARCYAQACRHDPSLAEAHLGIAEHALANGDHGEGVRRLRRAIELEPHALTPRLRLGRVLLDAGRFDAAERQFTECLRRSTDNADAHVALAEVQLEQHRLGEALESCEKALQHAPHSAAALALIGHIHLANGDTASAETAFDNAGKVDPGSLAGRVGRAAVLEAQGHLGDALPAVRAAIRDGGGVEAELVLARILRQLGDGAEARQRLRIQLASAPAGAVRLRRQIELELGRVFEADGHFAEALAHFRKSAELGPPSPDPALFRAVASRTRKFFNASTHARLSRARARAATPVILVGMPSTGVQDWLRILSAHSRVAPHSPIGQLEVVAEDLSSRIGSGHDYPECLSDARGADLDRIVSERWPQFDTLSRGDVMIVDATWQADLHLGLAEALFPNARVVYCTREARDTAMGCYVRDYPGPECGFAGTLTHIAGRLSDHQALMHHWRKIGDLRFLEASRESYAKNPTGEARRVLAFAGLSAEQACLTRCRPIARSGVRGVYPPVAEPGIGRFERCAPLLPSGEVAMLDAVAPSQRRSHD